jgi:hypothetical protein
MFEAQQEEDQQSSRRGIIVVVSIVLVLAIVGTLVYLDAKGAFKSSSTAAATSASPAAVANADPVKDLRILSTKMDKDSTGTTAVWLVDLKNSSQTLTYTHITYQTTYGGPNDSVIGQNTGEMAASLGPGEEQNVQFKDAEYPANVQWFKVAITGANASQ